MNSSLLRGSDLRGDRSHDHLHDSPSQAGVPHDRTADPRLPGFLRSRFASLACLAAKESDAGGQRLVVRAD